MGDAVIRGFRTATAAAIAATLAVGLAVADGGPVQIAWGDRDGVATLSNGRVTARWTQGLLPVLELQDGGAPYTVMLSRVAEMKDPDGDGGFADAETVLSISPTQGGVWARQSGYYLSSDAFEVALQGRVAASRAGLSSGAWGEASVRVGVAVTEERANVGGTVLDLNEASMSVRVESWPWVSRENVLAVSILIVGGDVRIADDVVGSDARVAPVSEYENRATVLAGAVEAGYVRWPASGSVTNPLGSIESLAQVTVRGRGSTESSPAGVEITFLFPSSYGANQVEYSPVVGVTSPEERAPREDVSVALAAGIAVVAVLALVMFRRRG